MNSLNFPCLSASCLLFLGHWTVACTSAKVGVGAHASQSGPNHTDHRQLCHQTNSYHSNNSLHFVLAKEEIRQLLDLWRIDRRLMIPFITHLWNESFVKPTCCLPREVQQKICIYARHSHNVLICLTIPFFSSKIKTASLVCGSVLVVLPINKIKKITSWNENKAPLTYLQLGLCKSSYLKKQVYCSAAFSRSTF